MPALLRGRVRELAFVQAPSGGWTCALGLSAETPDDPTLKEKDKIPGQKLNPQIRDFEVASCACVVAI